MEPKNSCSKLDIMEEDQELQNPFPSPPSHYTHYTSHNLHLLSLLKARLDNPEEVSSASDAEIIHKQYELLPNEKDVPEWPLTQLEKPRVDWILEEGVYNAFGDTWFVSPPETIVRNEPHAIFIRLQNASLLWPRWAAPSCIRRIPQSVCSYPRRSLCIHTITLSDRRPALQSVLRSLLQTYSSFLSSILLPPPSQVNSTQPDWQRLVEWMRVMGQNIMGAANDLRPVQVICLEFRVLELGTESLLRAG